MSLDLNPFGDFDRQYIANHARILKNSKKSNDLEFDRGDMIYVHKIKNQRPVRNFGSRNIGGKNPGFFLRSTVTKVLQSTDFY